MRYKSIATFLFFFLFSFSGRSQNKYPFAESIFDQEAEQSERANRYFKVCDSLWNISKKSVHDFVDYSKERAEKENDDYMLGQAYNRLGLFYLDIELYGDAYSHFQKAKALFEKADASSGVYLVISNLANLHYYMGKFEKGIRYENQAYEFLQKNPNISNYWGKVTNLYLNVGSMHGAQDSLLLARSCFFKAYDAYKKDPSRDTITRAYIFNNIATTYMNTRPPNWDSAMYFEQITFDLKLKYGNNSDKRDAYRNYSGVFEQKKDYKTEKIYLEKAFTFSDTENVDSDHLALLYGLALVNDRLQNYKEALGFLKRGNKLKNVLDAKEAESSIEQAEMREEFRGKTVSDSLQTVSRIQIKDMEISRRKTQSIFGTICLIIVSVLGLIAFRRYKMTQRQKLEIEEQKKIVDEKNREIRESISYARNLQDALIPDEAHLKKYFPEFFILYEPKDIVAGDFYWWHFLGEQSILGSRQSTVDAVLIAAADCTGHGVPGAMVSVVCINALNRAVNEFHLSEPKDVLMKVNELVNETFGKNNKNVNDGMDISLLLIDLKRSEIKWSGANNRLVYFDKELKEVKPSKHSIGKSFVDKKFEQFQMTLEKGVTYYLFTDGFADQFGGSKDKKMGFATLRKVMEENAKLPMGEQSTVFKNTFKDWKKGFEQTDDVTVVGLRV
jgi:serine phosphatase RsbU (regulator of sigma subunit)